MAISHASLPASGIQQFLDGLTQLPELQKLHPSLQRLLLRQLPLILASLSAAAGAQFLAAIANLPGRVGRLFIHSLTLTPGKSHATWPAFPGHLMS